MIKKTTNKTVYIIIIIFMILLGLYMILNRNINNKFIPDYNLNDFYKLPDRKMNVNEYSVTKLTEYDMIRIYFNDYINTFFSNPFEGYQYLNEEYRKEEYSTYDLYYKKVLELTNNFTEIPKIKDYKEETVNNKKKYKIRDSNDNLYTFIINAVMDYEVYLGKN